MIVIAGSVRIVKASRAAAVAAARRMSQATHTEAGCLAYTFSADLSDPALFHVFEAWTDADALQQHFQTSHMTEFNAVVPGLLAAPPKLLWYEVVTAQPF